MVTVNVLYATELYTFKLLQCLVRFFFFFLLCHSACRILIPQPRIKPRPLAVKALSRNHWTAKEVPQWSILCYVFDHNKKKSKYPASIDMSDLQTGHRVSHGNNQLELRSPVPFGYSSPGHQRVT